jgi:uncharacterized repeat protein (TIGR01451 family)
VDQGAATAVSPGSHDIGEVAVDLYSLNIIACVDEGQAALTVASGSITIEDERAVVCTLTNVFEGTPHISIDKRVDGVDGPIGVMVGDSVTYDWTVINDGDVTLHNVVVDDDTHNGLDANCGTLAVGQSCQGSTPVTFASPGSVTNIVTVTTTEEVSDSDSVTVSVGFEPPPPAIANLTVVKAGGEPGISYDFRLTHGALEVVHEFSLDSGESATMILFLNAEWNVVELDAPAGALSSGTCLGDNVFPNEHFTCTVTNPTPPAIEGSSLRITKALTSVDPASVGELVTFLVEVTAMGDSTLDGVTVVDTFEHAFLEFVSSTSACTLHADVPDADHSSLECVIGTLTPGTPGNPGTASLSIGITFRAIAATTPERTVNSAIAGVDGGSVGPAQADVEIVEVLGVQLPPSGDGSASPVPVPLPWALALAAAATAAVWYGIGRGLKNGRRY